MMKVVILKDEHEFRSAYGQRLFQAHFAGHWDGAIFVVRKDRVHGNEGRKMSSVELVNHINKLQEMI
jgi:hypothetical protein